MKKRWIAMLLVFTLLTGILPVTALAEGLLPFTDVKKSDWFYEGVSYVYESGLMGGTGNTTFSPNTATTRGMIVTILHRLEGTPAVSGGAFTDVAAGQYYTEAVAWASANSMVDGYGNGTFGPNDPITREQMAAILYRYAQFKGIDVSTAEDLSEFSDAAAVSGYAADAMRWAVGTGVISGVGDHALAPQSGATRAQVATILMRFCETAGISVLAAETHTVTFDYNYDGKGAYLKLTVQDGETVKRPSDPARSDYSFDGWYTKSSGGSKFDFNTSVTADFILYAHWNSNSNGDSANPVFYYTVTFDVVSSDVDNAPLVQQVRSGGFAVEPAAPFRNGYSFAGWYMDNTYTEQYDFQSPVTANITLYAKWNPVGSSDPDLGGDTDGLHRVTFVLNDGSSGVYEVQMVEDGGKASSPSSVPERELYGFTGWYEEPSGAVAYDFDNAVMDDITLYAGWGSPDPNTDGLYAVSNTEETIYSVSGLFMDDTGVTATVNVNSISVLLVEFFEDTLGENWTKDAMGELLSGPPVASVATYTPDYGELINVSIPVDTTLPQYYIAQARLISSEGTDLCEPFLYIEGSQQYAEFERKTINDYDQEQVINFDESITTNFGVLTDNTKKITISDAVNKLTVADIDVEGKVVPDHTYTFEAPDSTISGLTAGDIVYITGTQYLFKVKSVANNQGGSITVTPDNDAQLTDFYSTLKVDMGSASDGEIQPMMDIIDVDTSLSKEIGFPSVEIKPRDWLEIKWSASFKLNLDIKMVYDLHLFGEDYFEFSLISKDTIETSVEITASVVDDKGENPYKTDLLNGKGKVPIPTPIPGLEVYTKLGLPVELELTAGISATWKGTMKSGFTYNSYSGRNDVKDMEKSLELKAEGKAELKAGPEVALGVQLSGEVVSAEINASGGAKVSAAVSVSNEDVLNNVQSKHTCILCVSGEAKWFAEVHIKAEYDICKILSGDIFDFKLFGIEGPIPFPGSKEGKFYISIIPGTDSVFSKKGTQDPEWILGGGECPNIAYRTELKTVDGNDAELSGISVRVKKTTGTVDKSGNSTYVVYLHDGIYDASTNINGTDVSKSVIVTGNAQTVTLSPSTSDKKLVGKIVDSTNSNLGIADAAVKVSKDGLVIASAESDSNGDFEVSLPDGTYLVEVTKQGYLPFSAYQKVENDQDSTPMKTIELIPGSGMGGFRGIITDAVTGQPISGVTLDLRSGWENSSHGDIIKTLTTNSNGEFRYDTIKIPFTDIVAGLRCGNYTLTASKDGYIGTSFNITVLPGGTDTHPQQNAAMAPAETEGDTWRIVLTWGENPRDLDSHVVGSLTSGNSFHVYYSHKSQYDGGVEVCNLDRDDTTGNGTETITLNTNNSTPYYYYIYRYAGSGTVASSGAQIRVYHGADIVRTFNVPTGVGDGDYWNVFAVVDGQIVVRNTITDSADITYAGTTGTMAFDLNEMEEKANVLSSD